MSTFDLVSFVYACLGVLSGLSAYRVADTDITTRRAAGLDLDLGWKLDMAAVCYAALAALFWWIFIVIRVVFVKRAVKREKP